MKHFRDSWGRYTKAPSLTQEIYRIVKMTFFTGLIMTFAYTSYWLLIAIPHTDWYIEPVQAQTSLKTQSVALEGTIREVSMYTSRPEETDSTPCIGANGQDVCVLWKSGQNLCATNAFPIGTELEVDKLGSCLVVDRMASRFSERIDWYAGYDDDCLDGYDTYDVCPNLKRAKNFGLQNLLVSVK